MDLFSGLPVIWELSATVSQLSNRPETPWRRGHWNVDKQSVPYSFDSITILLVHGSLTWLAISGVTEVTATRSTAFDGS